MVRFYDNLKIIVLLFRLIRRYPDLRFTQLLYNLGINPDKDYNEEPERTLYRIKNIIARWN